MFLAIINDTYSEVKEELSSQKDELQFTDIIKQVKGSKIHGEIDKYMDKVSQEIQTELFSLVIQSYMKTFTKLKLKKEKISDVQKALRSGSGEIEFRDFRETLKE